jgi:hypothetical protein
MTPARIALLADRGVVRVTGEDAEKLLQGIVSNDMDLLASQAAIHTALLTPQGKILFDFFVAKTGGGFLLETARDKAADLAKRLNLYKLRAKVDIRDVSDEYRVLALWGPSPLSPGEITGTVSFPDPRLTALGSRMLAEARLAADIAAATNGLEASPEDYHAHRIALGVPEGGKDYVLGDTFPHEAELDQLNGVSFTKGCFVGQEVVSRMQNRASVRKRVVPIEGDAPLTSGAEIKVGAASIGAVGSVAGKLALENLNPSFLLFSGAFKKSSLLLGLQRGVSIAVSVAGLIATAPVFALIAIVIKLDSRGPIFFRQSRAGVHGRPFDLIKFRTMRLVAPGSERSLWAADNEDRITRVGRWLRRFRLDELPQFINILRGDMNLVGPRPLPVGNATLFRERIPYFQLRELIRPGLTGWAQVRNGYANGLAEETEKMRYDLYYIKNMSLWMDLRILADTAKAVISVDGS